jgi:hypothetical protein
MLLVVEPMALVAAAHLLLERITLPRPPALIILVARVETERHRQFLGLLLLTPVVAAAAQAEQLQTLAEQAAVVLVV